MKKKIYKIMGVGLTLVMVLSLAVALAPVNTAEADPGTLKFTKVPLPRTGEEGDYVLMPGTDVGPIATSPEGEALFASLYPAGAGIDPGEFYYWDLFELDGDVPELMKSTDGGYSWKMMDGFQETAGDDDSAIIDIVVAPDYDESETVFVATYFYVYQSVDGGETWAAMPAPWEGSEWILDLDVAMDERGRLCIMVGTSDLAGGGDVYVYGSKTLTWVSQGIGDVWDVLAVGFSPFYADDELIAAVVSSWDADTVTTGSQPATQVRFAVTPSAEEGTAALWGTVYGTARIRDAYDAPFMSVWARMAFPDDFSASGIGNNVCFVGVYSFVDPLTGLFDWTGTEMGDAYKITLKEATFSSAVDLDVRGVVTTLLPTATNIVSIDVCGEAEDANIIVGTDYTDFGSTPAYFLVYRSSDGGETWIPSGTKSPTGGDWTDTTVHAWTKVLYSHDFLDSDIAYAGTWGVDSSGFSRSKDSGKSWNQISLIDYDAYVVKCLSASGYNAADTLHMVTQTTSEGAVWQTYNGGKNWERIWSYANPGVTPTIDEVHRVGEETIFAVDKTNYYIWRSSDMGASWPKKITTKDPDTLTEVRFVSETALYTGFADGSLWWSTNSGNTWNKPEENPMTSPVGYIKVKGDTVLIGNVGAVHISTDGGETIERVGAAGDAGMGLCLVGFDLGFADNNIIYSSDAYTPFATEATNRVYRTEVDLDDPGDSEWVSIDDIQATTPYDWTNVLGAGPPGPAPPAGIMYIVDTQPVTQGDVGGGLWRCTNPTADVDGAHPPYFEIENRGLDKDDELAGLDADVFPFTLFCAVSNGTTAVPYYEQIVMFTDTLDSGVTPADPSDGATGVGLLPAGKTYPKVKLAWEEMAGATSYQWQIAIDSGFKSMADSGFTTSLVSDTLTLAPNKTYYWRVRVADESSLIGAPLISPWSDTWKFKTAIGAAMARPELEAPWAGQSGVDLSPTFEWSGIEWADKYEFELGTDPGTTARGYFVDVIAGKTGAAALVSTAWRCDIELDYNTRYYWHVKAIGVDTETPWSDIGTFTTMAEPAPAAEPVPPVVVPPAPAPITPAWIWAIVIIGAILVIAVVVLIVTTRRVP